MLSSLLRWFRSRHGTVANRAAGSKSIPPTKRTLKRPHEAVLRLEELESRFAPATGFIYGTIPAIYNYDIDPFGGMPTLVQPSSIVRIDATTGDQQTILSQDPNMFSPFLNPIAAQSDGTVLLITRPPYYGGSFFAGGIAQFNPAVSSQPTSLSHPRLAVAGLNSITVAPDGKIFGFSYVTPFSYGDTFVYEVDPTNGQWSTVWDQQSIDRPLGPAYWFNQIAAKNDGTLLFSGVMYPLFSDVPAEEGIFELAPGQTEPTLLASYAGISGVAVAPDGTIYASTVPQSYQDPISGLQVETPGSIFQVGGTIWQALPGEGPSNAGIAVESDGSIVFSGTVNGESGVFQFPPIFRPGYVPPPNSVPPISTPADTDGHVGTWHPTRISSTLVAGLATYTPAALQTATFDIHAYSGPYDATAHGISGTATGTHGEDLSSLLNVGATYTDAGHYTVNWTFAGNDTYRLASGTSTIEISRASPFASIQAVAATTYDGHGHVTTGQVTGVNGVVLPSTITYTDNQGNVGVGVPVNVGTYTATIFFLGDDNYLQASASTTIVINKAIPAASIISVTVDYDGLHHGTTGQVIGVNGNVLPSIITYQDGQNHVLSTAPVNPGVYTATITFAGDNNYTPASASANIVILSAADQLSVLIGDISNLGINTGNSSALISKLTNAITKLNQGNTTAAVNMMQAFINQVNALVHSGKLSAVDGDALIAMTEAAIYSAQH